MRKLALLFLAACGGGEGPGGPGPQNTPPVAAVAAGTTVVAGRAVVFDGSGYDVTFTRYRTMNGGVLDATGETQVFLSNRESAFLVSPENRVSIVAGMRSTLFVGGLRIR